MMEVVMKDSNIEEWRDIPEYEGYYQVSNFGVVKSLKRECVSPKGFRIVPEKILKPRVKRGYMNVGIQKNNKRKFYFVHQLVAMGFLNHKLNGTNFVINHKNYIKDDNRLENLEIVDVRYNTIYSIDKSKTTSKYTGVHWNKKHSKWRASIYDNKTKWLGDFENEHDAHIAYEKYLKTKNKT